MLFFRSNHWNDFFTTISDGCSSHCKRSSSTILRPGLVQALERKLWFWHLAVSCVSWLEVRPVLERPELRKPARSGVSSIPGRSSGLLRLLWSRTLLSCSPRMHLLPLCSLAFLLLPSHSHVVTSHFSTEVSTRGSTQRESLATQKMDNLECVPKLAYLLIHNA